MKKYMKLDDMEIIHFKLHPAQTARLADIYEDGEGVERNELRASNLYWWSAVLGDPYAQTVLANSYLTGKHIKKDETQALEWFRRSAEQGNPYAQYEVGMRVTDGDGSLLWLHSSAKQGFTSAMKELSDRLREVDPKRSKKWLQRYYRKKNTIETINGKKYMKQIRKMKMPEVINGEVVIEI